MDNIIWNVNLKEGTNLSEGKYVICLWDQQQSVYAVYFRGKLCGTVQLPWGKEQTLPDFLLGKVIECCRFNARIRICRGRAQNRLPVVCRFYLFPEMGAAA